MISTVPYLASSTQDSSTATAPLSTPHNPFNVTPIIQKPKNKSSTPPPQLNSAFLTSPPTVDTPSQAPKCKRRRIQFVDYLDDVNDAYRKQKKRARHKKLQVLHGRRTRGFIFHSFQIAVYFDSQ